jgi:hypothetical protein
LRLTISLSLDFLFVELLLVHLVLFCQLALDSSLCLSVSIDDGKWSSLGVFFIVVWVRTGLSWRKSFGGHWRGEKRRSRSGFRGGTREVCGRVDGGGWVESGG